MYACIKDPVTGRRLYADLSAAVNEKELQNNPQFPRIESITVKDIITEDVFVDIIVKQLKGIVIKSNEILSTVLKDTFNISADTCPELVAIVSGKMRVIV